MALKEMYPGMINSPETTITNNINESDTIIYVLDPARVPEPPNLMTLGTGTNAETVKVLEINDNAITVERGFQGVAKSWPAGTVIARNFTEYDYNALKENIEDLEATKETPQGAQEKADAALNSAKQYTDQEVGEVAQELAAHKADYVTLKNSKINRSITDNRNRKPMITIIDDDANKQVLNKWIPILQEKDFKLTIAAITSYMDSNPNYMTWEELKNLAKNYNVEVVNHTHTHPYLGDLTEEEVREELETSISLLNQHGFNSSVIVYPYGSGSKSYSTKQIVKEYVQAGVGVDGGINIPPLNTLKLNRVSLVPQSGEMDSVETYTSYIDEAIEKNGWLIFMSHSQYPAFDSDKIKAIIDYANANGVEFVHVNEGLEKMGNIIDIGMYDTLGPDGYNVPYTVIDAEGELHSNQYFILKRLRNNSVKANTPISDIPVGNSSAYFYSTQGFPETAGVVISRISHTVPNSSHQVLLADGNNRIYKRAWFNGAWTDFIRLDNQYVVVPGYNKYTANSLISEFPANTITTFVVNNAGATGFPNNTAGVVTTYNMVANGWHRQEYRKYNSNEIWTRYVDSTGNWTDWVQLGGGSGSTANRPNNVHIGYMYFDTTLGKPVWWNGTGWVDATGTTV